MVSGGKVNNNVTPGVFFYWVAVTAPAGNSTPFTITQTITTGNFTGKFDIQSRSNVFNSTVVVSTRRSRKTPRPAP
jgi:hypothetical protein